MWLLQGIVRFIVFCVIMIAVCWGVALLIEWFSPLDTLIDEQILQETSLPIALLKIAVPSMVVAAIVIGIYRVVGRLIRIR